MSEVIFSFDNSSDAVRAGIEMNKVDPSLRYMQMRTTVCASGMQTSLRPHKPFWMQVIPCTFQYWNDIKNSHRRGKEMIRDKTSQQGAGLVEGCSVFGCGRIGKRSVLGWRMSRNGIRSLVIVLAICLVAWSATIIKILHVTGGV
ncbi:Uncharacterised protein [Klebsiella michiganensis]|nr:Uncharacterised protein [Klebsiella michiganensis]